MEKRAIQIVGLDYTPLLHSRLVCRLVQSDILHVRYRLCMRTQLVKAVHGPSRVYIYKILVGVAGESDKLSAEPSWR